jgi:polysaccharide biosynthesis/export protein
MSAVSFPRLVLVWLATLALVAGGGCQAIVARPQARLSGPQTLPPVGEPVPTEKDKSTLAPYIIEPPDILFIEVLRLVPKPPYHLQANDVVSIDMGPDLIDAIAPSRRDNRYVVSPSGRIDLGPQFGKVQVAGLTEDEATAAIIDKLKAEFEEPAISLQLFAASALQPISGEHLVSPDGTVNLGTYGLCYVAGMTIEEAQAAVVAQLSKAIDQPQVSLSVFAYNSKMYYVITEGAGLGDLAARFPVTGNETVLDAITQIGGLSRMSSSEIWIARPAPGGVGCDEVLPVNWKEITKGGGTATNYQILPGDRIFIAENKMIALDSTLQKTIAPFERIFGFTLLSTQAIQTINRFPLGFNGSGSF